MPPLATVNHAMEIVSLLTLLAYVSRFVSTFVQLVMRPADDSCIGFWRFVSATVVAAALLMARKKK